MSENTVKLPRNARYRTQKQAFVDIASIDADIENAIRPFVDTKDAADWQGDCAIIARRVWDTETLPEIQAHNDEIQAGRACEVAQRKRISAAVGSPIVDAWCRGKKPCKSADTVKKMMAKRDITSLYSLQKELKRIAKSEKVDLTAEEQSAELVEANETARSELAILDPHGVDGLQGLFDNMRELIQECESVPTEDAPILEAAILSGFDKVKAAGEKREKAIEKADAKAELEAQKRAA